MTGRPLRPVTRRCLGGPLPRQQADGTRTIHSAQVALLSSLGPQSKGTYPVLARLSTSYPEPIGMLSTRYSPVRHFHREASFSNLVRLACVRHAASVRSEPGSNSPLKTGLNYVLA